MAGTVIHKGGVMERIQTPKEVERDFLANHGLEMIEDLLNRLNNPGVRGGRTEELLQELGSKRRGARRAAKSLKTKGMTAYEYQEKYRSGGRRRI